MRIKIIAIATFLIGFGLMSTENVQAQGNTDNATVSLATDVLTTLSLSVHNSEGTVDFGGITTNETSPTLDPTNTSNWTEVGADPSIATLILSGSSGASVLIETPASINLTGTTNTSNTITYNPWISHMDNNNGPSGSTTLYDASTGTSSGSLNIGTSQANDSDSYLYVGGKLTNISTADSYTGTIQVTATYN